MSETYEFIEATPVKRTARVGAGRKREDNPFESAVREIAGKTDEDGNPLARAVVITLDEENGETLKQRRARIRRFLTRAGKEIVQDGTEPLLIKMADEPVGDVPNTYKITFWHRQD